MRHTIFAILLFGLILSSSKAAVQPLPIQILIESSTQDYQIGSAIIIQVTLTNISKDRLTVARANGPNQAQFNYHVIVRDSAGHVIAPNLPKMVGSLQVPTAWSNITFTLEPSEQMEEGCEITKLFPISKLGKYSVEFVRTQPNDTRKEIHSNRLSFTIIK